MENRGHKTLSGRDMSMTATSRIATHIGLLAFVVAVRLEQNFNPTNGIASIIASVGTEDSLLPSQIAYNKTVTKTDQWPTPVFEPALDIQPPATLTNVTRAMENYRDSVFKDRDFEDIPMYLDIYKAAAARYSVDWRLLWIIHDKETMCSRMKETTMA